MYKSLNHVLFLPNYLTLPLQGRPSFFIITAQLLPRSSTFTLARVSTICISELFSRKNGQTCMLLQHPLPFNGGLMSWRSLFNKSYSGQESACKTNAVRL
ncbi:hypothetical protein XENTR_v10014307 [Xenopus tropicalis]|nr:hypothetical protein XENTR_v10014307 [Xenopus tropicalis]KAE8603345.1 hypothetical protein XENTR_v10014307 [Xenopus tropicalis]